MSDGSHLLIPDAGGHPPERLKTLAGLRLPWLAQLLADLSPQALQQHDPDAISTPFEHALAQACGVPGSAGRYPWGAWRARRAGLATGTDAWALVMPCHWEVGMRHVQMLEPGTLQLSAQESEALREAMRPYFEEDGMALFTSLTPDVWLARGDVFRALSVASPDRLRGQALDEWMPPDPTLRRLQNEMQMLLYTHPVNDARAERGLAPVNSVWISGCGPWPTGAPASVAPAAEPQVIASLRDAALHEDWNAWAQAWQAVDAEHCAALHARLRAGEDVRLTLCGARASQGFVTAPRSALQNALRWLRKPRVADVLGAL